MSEWKEYYLGKLLEITSSKRVMMSDYVSTGIPFYRSKEIIELSKGNRINSELFISNHLFEKFSKKFGVPKEKDLLLTSVGTLGIPYIVNSSDKFYFKDGNLTWFKNFNNQLNSKFLYYWFLSPIGKREVENIAIGSTQKALTIKALKKLKLSIPIISKQNKIVSILESIDKKIELNTQTNQTLEAIAQAIFKHWFIDFAPVHAKADALAAGKTAEQAELVAMASISGKTEAEIIKLANSNPQAYQQLQQTAAAFPSEFAESEMGLVPKGWEVKPLIEVFDFLEGPGIRNWQYTNNDDGVKFINIRCINNGDLNLQSANRITTEEAFGKYKHFQLKEDDIVISTSGTLGKIAIVRKEHLPLCLNTSVIRFRTIDNVSTFPFLKGFSETQLQVELEAKASGSVQRNFGPTHLKQISLLVPNFNLLERHQEFTQNLFNMRKSKLSENDYLRETRDTLLPKLLNGEVEL